MGRAGVGHAGGQVTTVVEAALSIVKVLRPCCRLWLASPG